MSGFVLTSYPPNPDPDNVAQVAWEFMCELLAMERGSKNGGIAVNKPGYHNTRRRLLANPDWRNDYSIRLPDDKKGPDNKSAGFDWTLGDEATMRKYGNRIDAAFRARDPRLHGWREALGQGDPDRFADGYDFVFWTTRTPDASHLWHWHFSLLRAYILIRLVYANMLSLLRGETLEEWRDGVSKEDVKEFYDWVMGGENSSPAQRAWRDDKFVPFLGIDDIKETASNVETLQNDMSQIKADVTLIKDMLGQVQAPPPIELDYTALAKAFLAEIANRPEGDS